MEIQRRHGYSRWERQKVGEEGSQEGVSVRDMTWGKRGKRKENKSGRKRGKRVGRADRKSLELGSL